jgi:phage terminase large subunit-like protein
VALIDEIHEHPSDMVVRKMSAGMKGRRQALQFEITNSGYDRHSICYQHHEYTEKILEGLIEDDAWFGYMTGLDVCEKCAADGKTIPQDGCPGCDDWRDEKNWIKANPNLPYLGAPFHDYLRRQVEEAKAMPSQENIVKRLNFCVWTESITRFIPADKWNACAFPVEHEDLKGRLCYGGLDLSSNMDLTAWVKIFPPMIEGGLYEVLCNFFLPEDNMAERVKRDKVPYDVWVRQGYITLTPGDLIDYGFILAQIERDSKDFQISELAFDRWGSQKITTDLQDLGFEIKTENSKADSVGMTLVQFGQGFASMAAPVKELEKMVIGKEIAHGGNPVLSWMISNVAIKMDPAGNRKIDKEKSTERVDGAVALVMAIGRVMLRQGPVKSEYEGLSVEEMKARFAI